MDALDIAEKRSWIAIGAYLQLLGAVLLFASLFLPWLNLGVGLAVNGDRLGNGDAITSSSVVFVIVSCAVALVAVLLLQTTRIPIELGQIGIPAGVLAAICAIVRYNAVNNQVAIAKAIVGSSAGIGFGWWVCFVALLLIFGGGLACRPLKSDPQPIPYPRSADTGDMHA
jgi:hypothetical protein